MGNYELNKMMQCEFIELFSIILHQNMQSFANCILFSGWMKSIFNKANHIRYCQEHSWRLIEFIAIKKPHLPQWINQWNGRVFTLYLELFTKQSVEYQEVWNILGLLDANDIFHGTYREFIEIFKIFILKHVNARGFTQHFSSEILKIFKEYLKCSNLQIL